MFIGHYALALAAKRATPRVSLGALFAATSLADLLWPVFLLLGWEQAHIVPGPNPFLTLWLDSIPISHSLVRSSDGVRCSGSPTARSRATDAEASLSRSWS